MPFWSRSEAEPEQLQISERLLRLVRAQLPDADDSTVEVVTAISGLLACVAFADRKLDPNERAQLRTLLGRVNGLRSAGADAICELLERNLPELTLVNSHAYTRVLREQTEVETRLEILDVLLEIAVADAELSFEETQLLRRLTGALGLDQRDYNTAQARHKARLTDRRGG
jgi:uncharacterized tellurite resistance protein B-like protein